MPEVNAPQLDPKNPRGLGVTCCSSCGQPISVIGKLGVLPQYPTECHYCAHDLDRFEVLADELEALVDPWIRACRERKVSERDIEEVFDIVEQRYMQHVADAKGHYDRFKEPTEA